MEYVPGGTLLHHINYTGPLHEEESRRFFQQLIMGLDYAHQVLLLSPDISLCRVQLHQHAPPQQRSRWTGS